MAGDAAAAEWQRLSPWSVVFLFVRTVVGFARENLAVLAGAGAGIAFIERIGLREVAVASALVLLIAAAAAVVYYRRFRFRVEGDVLRVQRGFFERSELKVPKDRIQHLALEEPLYLRIFGLVRFKVDTPGGQAADAELPGIRRAEAERLRSLLSVAAQAPAAGARTPHAAVPAEPPVFRVSARGLTAHGLSSSYVFAAVAAAAPLVQLLERRVPGVLADRALLAWLADRPLLGAVLLGAALLVAAVCLSVSVAWLRFYGFVLDRHDGRFTQTSGLFTRQEQILSIEKLQSVDWLQTAVGRLLDCSRLTCRQVGRAVPGRERIAETFVVPGLDGHDAGRLARTFLPALDTDASFLPVHRHYRRVLVLRMTLLAAGAFGLVAELSAQPRWLAGALAAPLLLWPLAHLRWRAIGWHATPRYVQVRWGVLRRRRTMFALPNVPRAAASQSWFQRRRGAATLTLTLASGPVTIPYMRETDAQDLLNRAVYLVESAALPAEPVT